jgi:SAM-dependent methyltransferase
LSQTDFALGARAGRPPASTLEDLAGRRVQEVARLAGDLLNLIPGTGGILDVAIGGGEAVPWYRSLFPAIRLVGLERSAARLAPALVRYPGMAHYREFDGTSIPYADMSFDIVTGAHSMLATAPDRRDALAAELFRVLRPGGMAVLFEPNPRADRSGGMGWPVSGRLLAQTLRQVGFRDTAVRYSGVVSGPLDRALSMLPLGPECHVFGRRH